MRDDVDDRRSRGAQRRVGNCWVRGRGWKVRTHNGFEEVKECTLHGSVAILHETLEPFGRQCGLCALSVAMKTATLSVLVFEVQRDENAEHTVGVLLALSVDRPSTENREEACDVRMEEIGTCHWIGGDEATACREVGATFGISFGVKRVVLAGQSKRPHCTQL